MTAAAVLYAFGLGLVAAVNPCGFPLLPAYLAIFTRVDATDGSTRASRTGRSVSRGLLAGAGVTVGFVAVFSAAGVLVHAGVSLVLNWLPWPMMVFGASLVVLGVLVAAGRSLHLSLPAMRLRTVRRTLPSMVLFGVAYAVGSLTCALPLFLAAVTGSFTRLGLEGGVACYLAYALGMGLFVTAAAVMTAALGAGIPTALRRGRRFVPRLSGVALALSGLYLTLYWLSERASLGASPLTSVEAGSGATWPLRELVRIQAEVSADVGSHALLVGGVLVLVVTAALARVVHRLWTDPEPSITTKDVADE